MFVSRPMPRRRRLASCEGKRKSMRYVREVKKAKAGAAHAV